MNQRLMVALEIEKEGQQFILQIQNYASYELVYAALDELRSHVVEMEKVSKEASQAKENS